MDSVPMRKAAESRWRPNDPLYNNMHPRTGNCLGEAYPKPCYSILMPPGQVFIRRVLPHFVPPVIPPKDLPLSPVTPAGLVIEKRVHDKKRATGVVAIPKDRELLQAPAGLVYLSHRVLNMF
jgi:hypothetical protein